MLLKKGTHAFPFEILLSNALSESIECGLGHIRYKLLCQVHVKPKLLFFIKSILQSQKPVVLIRLPFIENQQSVSQTHIMNEQGGQLTLHIERGQLIPGTLLPITFHFNSLCNLNAIDQLSVKLIERQKYKAPSKQTTRILHHEIALSPNNHHPNFTLTNSNELRMVYVVPDKHTLKVRPSASHTNIRVRHWLQIHIKLLLNDGTIKDLQIDVSILVSLSSMDDYLNLPVYHQLPLEEQQQQQQQQQSHPLSNSTSITSISPNSWLKKIYPIKNNHLTADHNNNNLMMLITAPPPLYEEIH